MRFDSPALDAGHSGGLTTDQRGLPRPIDDPNTPNAEGGNGSDIGAYEADPNLRITGIGKAGSNVWLSFNSLYAGFGLINFSLACDVFPTANGSAGFSFTPSSSARLSASVASGQMLVNCAGTPGATYLLARTPALPPPTWVSVTSGLPDLSGKIVLVDPLRPPSATARGPAQSLGSEAAWLQPVHEQLRVSGSLPRETRPVSAQPLASYWPAHVPGPAELRRRHGSIGQRCRWGGISLARTPCGRADRAARDCACDNWDCAFPVVARDPRMPQHILRARVEFRRFLRQRPETHQRLRRVEILPPVHALDRCPGRTCPLHRGVLRGCISHLPLRPAAPCCAPLFAP